MRWTEERPARGLTQRFKKGIQAGQKIMNLVKQVAKREERFMVLEVFSGSSMHPARQRHDRMRSLPAHRCDPGRGERHGEAGQPQASEGHREDAQAGPGGDHAAVWARVCVAADVSGFGQSG